ncbi:MAG: histidinol-phosphate transaminase [Bdellovibrionales bacterium]
MAYKICAQATGVYTIESSLKADLSIDLKQMYSLYKIEKPRLIFLPNPNNPTGTYVGENELVEFLEKMRSETEVKIVIDEAYNEYVRADDYANSMDLFAQYQNVVVMRTFSKIFGLAGLRVGTLIADENTIDYVNRVRNPFNVNSLAQEAAIAILGDTEYVKKAQQVNWQGLDFFYEKLGEMGVEYIPSQTNFVLFDCQQPAQPIFEKLLQLGVIVRPVAGYGLPNHLRMSVGLMPENEAAIEALKRVL